MSAKLTVIIPCKNERENIGACVASARQVADEVLVADSGSTDGTLEIARELGCRIIEREYGTSGDFKNWAIPQAANEWVFILDADERITPSWPTKFATSLPNRSTMAIGFIAAIISWAIRSASDRGGTTAACGCSGATWAADVGPTDHAEVELASGTVGRLRERLTHYTCSRTHSICRSSPRYADVQGAFGTQQGRAASWRHLLLRFPLRFLQGYVLRSGFLDGLAGLQVCVLVAYLSWLKQAYLVADCNAGRDWQELEQH